MLGIHPHVKDTILVGAAHCYQKGNRYYITCGEHELNNKEAEEIEFEVTNVIVHPKFKSADQGYDIAIFKVRSSDHSLP